MSTQKRPDGLPVPPPSSTIRSSLWPTCATATSSGMTRRDWRIFLGSTAIANGD
ncbi:MAG: hypothetical protein MZV49_14920 [Rhodopseudomonas palustris]|nr:hypothetical protein [Rhodopseudomonas palustris]